MRPSFKIDLYTNGVHEAHGTQYEILLSIMKLPVYQG